MAASSTSSPILNWTRTSKSCTSIWGFENSGLNPGAVTTKEEYRMKHLVSLAALAAALACGSAQAQTTVKIGVMSDMSSLYSDIAGPGSTAAAKLAIADFQKANPNVK